MVITIRPVHHARIWIREKTVTTKKRTTSNKSMASTHERSNGKARAGLRFKSNHNILCNNAINLASRRSRSVGNGWGKRNKGASMDAVDEATVYAEVVGVTAAADEAEPVGSFVDGSRV